jgi:Bacterial PH domain
MASWKLRSNERILLVGRPAIASVWLKYLLSAGLYAFWRKRNVVILTDQRVILGKGVMSRQERSIPISRIDGAAYNRNGLAAYCELGIPDREGHARTTRLGPLRVPTARRFVQELEERI